MRRNTVKQRLLNGETVIGTMIQEMRVPAIAQIVKAAGYDFFMLDMEHGAYSLETAADILRVGRLLDLCPLVRVASPEYDLIARPLDHGAMGVMMPRIETRDQVERFIEAMKYPPQGKRGCSSDAPHAEYDFGPLPEFLATNNLDTLAIAQIERKVAIERLDDLLSVPGVDAALIGPEDLSVSLGVPGEISHPAVVEAIETVIAAAHRHNVVPGIHMGSVEKLQGWMAKGMRLIMYWSDLGFLLEAGAAGLAQLRGTA
jgi:2-dehydro-3-deoxyglucarate aldolase/4-hydroxy-2-oxoheptanedioate aldolase